MWPVMVYSGIVFTALPAWAHVWFAGAAVYALCRRELDGRVAMLHIGETADLARGIGAGRAPWDEAVRLGMTEIHIHVLAGGAAERRALVSRLRRRYATPLDRENPVHRDLARLAEALAPHDPPAVTFFDWLEAMVVARPYARRTMHGSGRGHPAPSTDEQAGARAAWRGNG